MPQNGDIVRNKRTGEMGVFQNGQVVPQGAQGQPTADRMIAPPDPYKQQQASIAAQTNQRSERNDARDARSDDLSNQIAELTIQDRTAKLAEENQKATEAKNADIYAKQKILRVVKDLTDVGLDANDNGGWFETGASGKFSRDYLPSSSAGNALGKNVSTLSANFAFDALQAMRDASKTGGALGAVSEIELELLKNSISAVDPNIDHETFMGNVEKARQAYLAKLADIDPNLATRLGYDQNAAQSALESLMADYNAAMGVDESVAFDRSPDMNTANTPMNEIPSDIDAIMKKYGAQ